TFLVRAVRYSSMAASAFGQVRPRREPASPRLPANADRRNSDAASRLRAAAVGCLPTGASGRPPASAAGRPPAGEEQGAGIEVAAGGQGDPDGVRGPAIGGAGRPALRRADEEPRVVAPDRARPDHDRIAAGPLVVDPVQVGGA